MFLRIEVFGLIVLEVLFVGFFVFVSENLGFGQVLSILLLGDQFVVKFNDLCEWVR